MSIPTNQRKGISDPPSGARNGAVKWPRPLVAPASGRVGEGEPNLAVPVVEGRAVEGRRGR